VFDLDSPQLSRFDETDRAGLESIAKIFLESLA
jgi:GAF domain-containing protein